MSIRGRWEWLLLLCAPAYAFVFVPQRAQGGVQPAWQVERGESASAQLAADLDGNLYLTLPTAIEALEAGTGERLWRHEAPAGYRFSEPVQPGSAAVVTVARSESVPAEAIVTALAIEPDNGAARRLWERRGLAVPAGGVHLPLAVDREQGDLGVVAVIAGDQLLVLSLADGQVKHRTELGTPLGEPVWGDGTVWVPLADGGVAQASLDGSTPRRIALPDDNAEQVVSCGPGGLLVIGRGGVYLVPTDRETVVIGAAGEQVTGGPGTLYAAGIAALRALGPDGKVRWTWPLPASWGIAEAPLPGEQVVVVTLRQAAAPSTARVVALRASDGTVVWQAEGLMPAGGVQRVPSKNGELVGLLLDGELQVREAGTGAERSRRVLGEFVAPPVWVADSGFVATSAGLAGFDLPQAGQPDDPSRAWLWKAAESLESVTWLPTARILVAVSGQRIYVFE